MTAPNRITDTLIELINIGAGKAASSLNALFGTHINLKVPSVKLLTKNDNWSTFLDSNSDNLFVMMDFSGEITGKSVLAYDLTKIGPLLKTIANSTSSEDTDFFRISVLTEVSNIVINAMVGSISNMVHTQVVYSIPQIYTSMQISSILPSVPVSFSIEAVTTFNFEKFDFTASAIVLFTDNLFTERFLSLFDK